MKLDHRKKKSNFSPLKDIIIETFGEKWNGNSGLEINIVSMLTY